MFPLSLSLSLSFSFSVPPSPSPLNTVTTTPLTTTSSPCIQSLLDFERARMFEYMVEVYKLLIPMYEHSHLFDRLSTVYSSGSPLATSGARGRTALGMSECYEQIVTMDKQGRRFFGTYFRIGYMLSCSFLRRYSTYLSL